MEFKLIELALVCGGLWLLWRSANRLGAQAKAEREKGPDDAGDGAAGS